MQLILSLSELMEPRCSQKQAKRLKNTLAKQQSNICIFCKKIMVSKRGKSTATLEHLFSFNDIRRLLANPMAASCYKCNMERNRREIAAYYKEYNYKDNHKNLIRNRLQKIIHLDNKRKKAPAPSPGFYMEVKVIVDISPAFASILNRLTDAILGSHSLPGGVQIEPVKLHAVPQETTVLTGQVTQQQIGEELKKKNNKKDKVEEAKPPVVETTTGNAKVYTVEEVRAKAMPISKNGKREEVTNLIRSYGAAKLADLDPKHYSDFMDKLDTV